MSGPVNFAADPPGREVAAAADRPASARCGFWPRECLAEIRGLHLAIVLLERKRSWHRQRDRRRDRIGGRGPAFMPRQRMVARTSDAIEVTPYWLAARRA
jgi:hypothetical protein